MDIPAATALHAALLAELPHHCPAGIACCFRDCTHTWYTVFGNTISCSAAVTLWALDVTQYATCRHDMCGIMHCRQECRVAGPDVESHQAGSPRCRDAGGFAHYLCCDEMCCFKMWSKGCTIVISLLKHLCPVYAHAAANHTPSNQAAWLASLASDGFARAQCVPYTAASRIAGDTAHGVLQWLEPCVLL